MLLRGALPRGLRWVPLWRARVRPVPWPGSGMLLHFFPFIFWEESRGFPELRRWGLGLGEGEVGVQSALEKLLVGTVISCHSPSTP